MKIPIYHIDTFTTKVFSGNPAAVCPLEYWLEDEQLQTIASENNILETAFFVDHGEYFQLRLFTPQTEVNLSIPATLASAFLIMKKYKTGEDRIIFGTHSGELIVKKQNELITMELPAHESKPCKAPKQLLDAFNIKPKEVLASNYYLAVYHSEKQIRMLWPYMQLIKELDRLGVIVTAPGDKVDFVSRFFAPSVGIPEDPVDGFTHCVLAPYWSKRLKKDELCAQQLSRRGGELFCKYTNQKVTIGGKAVVYLEGKITI
jgi:PhzF family phenazine biosynthesis protein